MSSKRVLIVATEDQEIGALADYLEQRGVGTEVVPDEEKALSVFRCGRHNIVLVDVDLPGLVFNDLVKAMLDIQPVTRIIVLTASERPDMLLHAVERGVSSYTKRPLDREKLSSFIETL